MSFSRIPLEGTFGTMRRWSRSLIFLTLVGAVFPAASHLAAQTASPHKPKKVFAHHMGSLNVGRGAMAYYTRTPQFGDPAVSNGGDYRTLSLAPFEMWNLTLEESADLQIRRAMRAGIDGFAVNAWAGGDEAKKFLDALFKVAEEKDYPFEISICPDANAIDQSNGFTNAMVDAMKYLLDRHGNSPKLARRDGKPIIFGYQSNWIWVEYLWRKYENQELVDIARTTPEGWELIKDAYEQIERLVGQQLYFQFDMGAFYSGLKTRGVPEDGHYRAAQVVAKHMPAVNEFLPSRHTMDYARAAQEAGAEWGHPIYLNYDNNRTNWAHGGPGTNELRRRWQEAREVNSTLMQWTTWNDYHEATNLSPGLATNYSFFDLNSYFIDWWKSGKQPAPTKDRVYVFSRKYPRDAKTFPFQSKVYVDGVIEVLTILPQPARIRVPGRGEYDAPAGLHFQHFPVTPGAVSAEVIRNNQVQLRVTSPEPVTDKPFRQDNGIVGISSECERHWQLDFGSAPVWRYSEYGDVDGDGLPNWFEMYWFGKPWDFSTATAALPSDVANSAGLSNLQSFQAQSSPVAGASGVVERRPYGEAAAAIPGRIEAEHFDLGGLNIAYFDTISSNQGGKLRPDENVDIETTADAGGGHNVGWTAAGEWIEYTVDVQAQGSYDLLLRVASTGTSGRVRLLVDGAAVTETVSIPNTGGWQSWQTVTVPVELTAGEKVIRLAIDGGGFNLNYFEFIGKVLSQPSVVTLSSPSQETTLTAGGSVELVAEASAPGGSLAKVEFFANGTKIGEAASSPYRFTWTNLVEGSHVLTARAIDVEGGSTTSEPVTVLVGKGGSREPFHGAATALPGRVRAVEFDLGGEGIAYHDTTSTNQGQQFRKEETVDIESTGDEGAGYNVGWVATGEWLLYTVTVEEAGSYELRARVASTASGRSFRVCFDGGSECRIDVPNTGGWQTWTTVTVPDVELKAGEQTMKISFDSDEVNVNFIEVQPATAAAPATSFAAWQQTYFDAQELQNAEISGDTADASRNGVPNLMEYALNRDPRSGGREGLPEPGTTVLAGETYLTLTYRRPAGIEEVEYHVDVSPDLQAWSSGADQVVPVSVTAEGETEVVVVRDAHPLKSASNRFIRLRVQRSS